jgi:hypothetical protein
MFDDTIKATHVASSVATSPVQQCQSFDIHLFLMYATYSGDVNYIFETLTEDGHNMSGASETDECQTSHAAVLAW